MVCSWEVWTWWGGKYLLIPFLQKELSPRNVQFMCTDVICKYWPYLQRVVKDCPELSPLLDMKPFLSVMHAKAHSWKCEVNCFPEYEGTNLWLGYLWLTVKLCVYSKTHVWDIFVLILLHIWSPYTRLNGVVETKKEQAPPWVKRSNKWTAFCQGLLSAVNTWPKEASV